MAQRTLTKWKGDTAASLRLQRIHDLLKEKNVLRGLSTFKSHLFVEIVLIMDIARDQALQSAEARRQARRLLKRGPREIRLLRKRLDALRTLITTIKKQIATITDNTAASTANPLLAVALHARRLPQRVAEIETIVGQIDSLDDVPMSVPEDRATGTVDFELTLSASLYCLLTKHFGLNKSDASQRVARVESALWGGSISDTDSDARNRSDAIRKRMKRYEVICP